MQRNNIKLRLMLADRLRCTLSDIGRMPVAEFNLIIAGYRDRSRRR